MCQRCSAHVVCRLCGRLLAGEFGPVDPHHDWCPMAEVERRHQMMRDQTEAGATTSGAPGSSTVSRPARGEATRTAAASPKSDLAPVGPVTWRPVPFRGDLPDMPLHRRMLAASRRAEGHGLHCWERGVLTCGWPEEHETRTA